MNNKPLVSVLITAYNEEKKIGRAIESILNQTYKNFELIIINDGSTDGTDNVVKQYNDERIVYVNRSNKGRIPSLNEAIFMAKGKYYAINDADDYSLEERLEKQVEYLEQHPEVGVLGTAYYRLDSIRNEKYIRRYPTDNDTIVKEMCKYIPMCQGSLMCRTEVIKRYGGYSESSDDVEDLALWLKIGTNTKYANLVEPYYVYDLSMETSYFHNNFTKATRNKKIFLLNCKAVKVFGLKKYMYIYPIMRFIYPYLPNWVKKIARISVSKINEENIDR